MDTSFIVQITLSVLALVLLILLKIRIKKQIAINSEQYASTAQYRYASCYEDGYAEASRSKRRVSDS